jgi:hypothetical protein
MSKAVRDANSPVVKLNNRPGPADYSTLTVHKTDRPLTAKKSHIIAETFPKARKDAVI